VIELGGLVCLRSFVQRLWRDIGTVGPSNSPTVQKEPLKVLGVTQRLKDRAIEPRSEVHGALDTIGEL